MKPLPEERRILERMAPGVLARDGFLGADTRPLAAILADDAARVARLRTTHAEIAHRLRDVLDAAMAAYGTPFSVDEGVTAVYREAMGSLPCPWGGCGTFAKGQVEVTDRRTGLTLHLTPLSVHLVEAHGFYQGHGAPYRLDPADLCRVFRIRPETA